MPRLADAGPDQVAIEGDLVTLDGRASVAPVELSIQWVQVAGAPQVELSDVAGLLTTFDAPAVPEGQDALTLTFRLSLLAADETCDAVAGACATTTVTVTRRPVVAGNEAAAAVSADGSLELVLDSAQVDIVGAASDTLVSMTLDPGEPGTPPGPGAGTYAGFAGNDALPQSITVTTELADGSFAALVRLYYDEADIDGMAESSLRLFVLNETTNTWELAGSASRDEGVAMPPDPFAATEVGMHGVSTSNHYVWAIVDGFSTFGGGVPPGSGGGASGGPTDGGGTGGGVVVTLDDEPDEVFVGQDVTYTVTITNNTDASLTNVALDILPLPPNAAFVSGSLQIDGAGAGNEPDGPIALDDICFEAGGNTCVVTYRLTAQAGESD